MEQTNNNIKMAGMPNVKMVKKEEENPALHFFLYLISFFALGFSVSGVISIIYAFIEKFIKDVAEYSYYSYGYGESIVKYGISSILAAGTVYIIIMWYISKLLYKGSIPENSKARKWLTYIVMFFAAATILGDLVTIFYNFLGGEMASKFFLKALIVLIIAGAIFGFYFWDMKKRDIMGKKYKINSIAGIILISVFLILIIAPFFSISNPFEARKQNIDDATVSRLTRIDNSIKNFYQENNRLPSYLSDLKSSESYYVLKDDDIKDIGYKIKNKTGYELCTNFLADSKEDIYYYNKEWQHKKGSKCFSKEVTEKINY